MYECFEAMGCSVQALSQCCFLPEAGRAIRVKRWSAIRSSYSANRLPSEPERACLVEDVYVTQDSSMRILCCDTMAYHDDMGRVQYIPPR